MENLKKLRRFWRKLVSLELGVYAANASFFILLSLFPGMLLLIGLIQYTPLTPTDLQTALARLLPEALLPLLDYMTQELFAEQSVALLSISAVTALWTASKGAYSLLRGLNRVEAQRERRSYALVRLRCAAFTLLLLVALLLTAALHLFGRHLALRLADAGLWPLRLLAKLLRQTYWIMGLLLSAFFSFVYTVLPAGRRSLRSVLPGALFSSAGWEGFSALFSYYVSRFGNYSLYYGSLSVIALTMLWLYVCMEIVFLGAVLNRLLRKKGDLTSCDTIS